jgi:hypothetical protein
VFVTSLDRAERSAGSVAGVVAWLTGLVVTFGLAWTGVSQALGLLRALSGNAGGTIGGYFLVHLRVLGKLTDGGSLVLVPYVVLPIILLVGAGFYVGRRTAGVGVWAAVDVTKGYLTAATLSLLVFQFTSGGVGVGQAIYMLGVTGVAFPLVFGRGGGVLARSVSRGSIV